MSYALPSPRKVEEQSDVRKVADELKRLIGRLDVAKLVDCSTDDFAQVASVSFSLAEIVDDAAANRHQRVNATV
jgi:hypothetical protein